MTKSGTAVAVAITPRREARFVAPRPAEERAAGKAVTRPNIVAVSTTL